MSRYTLMDYFSIYVEEWDSLLEEFLRHLAMTSFSVVLALIIAVPLGIFITRNKAVSNVVIGIANVMQSIPCMALLAMGIPFLGVGETLAIFMVFVYAFLPILKNTYTGISGISPVSMEVARGIGLTRMQQLRRSSILHKHIDAALLQGVKAHGRAGQAETLFHLIIGICLDQLRVDLTQNVDLGEVGGAHYDGLLIAAASFRPAAARIRGGPAAGGQREGHGGGHRHTGESFQVFHTNRLLFRMGC